ncbi:MAG: multicopper oxidase family protein [Candidatus Palauibacterales bacterium]|nr:multicopper oxidase family protein [Candidatus Palauibacterales bacterium]
MLAAVLASAAPHVTQLQAQQHAHEDSVAERTEWRAPPMPGRSMPVLPSLMGLTPPDAAWLPGEGIDPASLPEAVPGEVVEMADGDTLRITAMRVRRTIRGQTLIMYGFNGQYPGPLIKVDRDATIYVHFSNEIDLPSTIHWHGVRVDNRFDGVPAVTQEPVEPGESFLYEVHLPDAGIYWYHPHVRTEIQQDLGLYGNIMVRHPAADYFNPVNREQVLILDDLLLDERGIFPYGAEGATQALMGRFGNLLLVNGEPEYRLQVSRGEVVRFFLTNVSNTRTFNLSFGGAPMKLVGADIGRFEREEMVESVPIGPAQRYIVEVYFREPGEYRFANRIQAIDVFRGEFYPRNDTLGIVSVVDEPASEDHSAVFERLREHPTVVSEIDAYRKQFERPVDHEIVMSVRVGELPGIILNLMAIDTLYKPPVEFNDVMPMMNFLSSEKNVTWILRDPATGRENMDIHWRFEVGDVAKIRIFNDPRSFHPMQHPMHFHGQRFLVLARDGVPNDNLVWKDTVLVPVGSRVDILFEASNPGEWLAHCHILEHVEAGMKMVLSVIPAIDP